LDHITKHLDNKDTNVSHNSPDPELYTNYEMCGTVHDDIVEKDINTFYISMYIMYGANDDLKREFIRLRAARE